MTKLDVVYNKNTIIEESETSSTYWFITNLQIVEKEDPDFDTEDLIKEGEEVYLVYTIHSTRNLHDIESDCKFVAIYKDKEKAKKCHDEIIKQKNNINISIEQENGNDHRFSTPWGDNFDFLEKVIFKKLRVI